jgi:formylmethanofuran dehydrogenase subunit B
MQGAQDDMTHASVYNHWSLGVTRHRGNEKRDVLCILSRKLEILQKPHTFVETRKDGELSLKRILAKEEVKGRNLVPFARFPVRVAAANRELVV